MCLYYSSSRDVGVLVGCYVVVCPAGAVRPAVRELVEGVRTDIEDYATFSRAVDRPFEEPSRSIKLASGSSRAKVF